MRKSTWVLGALGCIALALALHEEVGSAGPPPPVLCYTSLAAAKAACAAQNPCQTCFYSPNCAGHSNWYSFSHLGNQPDGTTCPTPAGLCHVYQCETGSCTDSGGDSGGVNNGVGCTPTPLDTCNIWKCSFGSCAKNECDTSGPCCSMPSECNDQGGNHVCSPNCPC